MIAEAMIKTLLDQTDPRDMLKPDAPKTMFIESTPMEATHEYSYAAGTHNGISVLYSFDRITYWKESMLDEFQRAAAAITPKPAGGAIFRGVLGTDNAQWLTLHLFRDKTLSPDWGRMSTITVNNEKLKNDPKFRLHWTRLRNIVESGDMTQLAESAPILASPKRSALESFAHTLTQVLRR